MWPILHSSIHVMLANPLHPFVHPLIAHSVCPLIHSICPFAHSVFLLYILLFISQPGSSIMVLDPNLRTSVSPNNPEHPVVTTPINTGSHTLHYFGNRYKPYKEHHWALGVKMSPYFIGSMPINAFLDAFLPLSLS